MKTVESDDFQIEWDFYPPIVEGFEREDKPLPMGFGSYGVVFLAKHARRIDQKVAIKFLHRELAVNPENRERFINECKHLCKLRHPNCVRIISFDESAKVPYLIMEYIEGVELSQVVADGWIAFADAARIARDIAWGLQHAHEQNPPIVHRDVKPRNVLIEKDFTRTVLTDFGIARALPPRVTQQPSISTLTRLRQQAGTPEYMPPEQIDPSMGRISPASDIYALGATLYEMLTGRPPFPLHPENGYYDFDDEILNQSYWPIATFRPETPDILVRVTMRCLQRNPRRRFQTAAEVAAVLDRFSKGLPVKVRLPGLVERLYDFLIAHRLGLMILAAVVTLGATLFSLTMDGSYLSQSPVTNSNIDPAPPSTQSDDGVIPKSEVESLNRAINLENDLENSQTLTIAESIASKCNYLIIHHPDDPGFPRKNEWPILQRKAINALGDTYLKWRQFDKANLQYQNLLEAAKSIPSEEARAYNGLAAVATEKMNKSEGPDRRQWQAMALSYLEKAKKAYSNSESNDNKSPDAIKKTEVH